MTGFTGSISSASGTTLRVRSKGISRRPTSFGSMSRCYCKPEQIGNPALKQGLQDVIDSNVGWVNLGDFSPSERAEIAEALHTALVSESNRRLPSTVPTRSQVLDLLRELARLAYTATPR